MGDPLGYPFIFWVFIPSHRVLASNVRLVGGVEFFPKIPSVYLFHGRNPLVSEIRSCTDFHPALEQSGVLELADPLLCA